MTIKKTDENYKRIITAIKEKYNNWRVSDPGPPPTHIFISEDLVEFILFMSPFTWGTPIRDSKIMDCQIVQVKEEGIISFDRIHPLELQELDREIEYPHATKTDIISILENAKIKALEHIMDDIKREVIEKSLRTLSETRKGHPDHEGRRE